MKSYSSEKQEGIVNVGMGKYHVYMDAKEVQHGNYTEWECDYVEIEGIPTYPKVVDSLIRERYSVSDEIALLRQRDAKAEDFAEYNQFCEQCKAKARPVFSESNGGE